MCSCAGAHIKSIAYVCVCVQEMITDTHEHPLANPQTY